MQRSRLILRAYTWVVIVTKLRIKRRTMYKRHEDAIATVKRVIQEAL